MRRIIDMRAYFATSLGVVGAAALLLPLAPHVDGLSGSPAGDGVPPDPARGAARQVAGSTQSLPFRTPEPGARGHTGGRAGPALAVTAREVQPYALVGVVWERADAPLRGRVEVRTRAEGSGKWTGWRELEAHPGDAPGELSGGADRGAERERGATAPLWVGDSDAVQARVTPGTDGELPEGLRLELVNPGPDPAPSAPGADRSANPGAPGAAAEPANASDTPGTSAAPSQPPPSAQPSQPDADASGNTSGTPSGEPSAPASPPASSPASSPVSPPASSPASPASPSESAAPLPKNEETAGRTGSAPRPRIVSRKGWGADEKLREAGFGYTNTVKAAFVHHTAMSNNYSCSQAPSIIRSIYRYHVKSSHWRDIGYNFLVDKCGTIYEGRAGGVAKPVMGAHTYGFNTDSTGIAVIGSYGSAAPPAAALDAVSKLSAWKLGLNGVNAGGSVTLTSGGGKYKKGQRVKLHTISGHRDGFNTECPGAQLYRKLGTVRTAAARMQGR